MKIIIATPISPPQIGGPAKYSQKLKEGLEKNGIEVKTISYFRLKKYPKPLRYFLYFFNLLKASREADIIYAFNLTSCGLAAFLVKRILRKKFTIRLGGDFLWERAVEKGIKKTLREFYEIGPQTIKEKFYFYLIKAVLNGADKIIFTTTFQRDIYLRHFQIKKERTEIIKNPFPDLFDIEDKSASPAPQLLYAGRLLKLKNLDVLLEVFREVRAKTNKNLSLKLIGSGPEEKKLKNKARQLKIESKVIFEKPLPPERLWVEIQKSYLCVLPSLTEISPNLALECLKLKKPILLTKETGIYEDYKDYLIFIDPQNQKDIKEKILYLLDEKNYKNYIEKIKKVEIFWNWENVLKEHLKIFKNYVLLAKR